MRETFDLAVVGAGIIGAMTAHRAREAHPDWRVLLADRSLVGSGATYFSPGHNHPHGLTPEQRTLAGESTAYYLDLRSVLPELPLHDCSMFAIVSEGQVGEVLEGYVRPGMHVASEAERSELRSSFPDLTLGAGQVLLTGVTGGYGHPAAIAARLARRLEASERGRLWEGTEIESYRPSGEGVLLSASDGRAALAHRVVVATGPWMKERTPALRVKKVVALHIDAKPTARDPILYLFDDDSYLLPSVTRGQWILSFPSEHWDCPIEPSRLRIDRDDRALALLIVGRYSASLAARASGGRVSCDGYTADRLPLIARSDQLPNLVHACGGSGYGFRLAPAIASRALALLESGSGGEGQRS